MNEVFTRNRSNDDQFEEWMEYVDSLTSEDRRYAAWSFIGYVLGDIPPDIFEGAMKAAKRNLESRDASVRRETIVDHMASAAT